MQLVREGDCDVLSLGLPEIARALICAAPHSYVRALGAAIGEFIDYRPEERSAALAQVGASLDSIVAKQDLRPGDGLLAPLARP
ncbi:hypothetical protein QBA57_00770 [Streptomyces scabiei]|uniref:hypothetical protein n=1 Tax=Streptomyces scabiei TaxID=1930 RepID=UPI000B283F86|nr:MULTISPECIES: hypothetical protein [Streptomyces]MDW8478165.1 hypothetical protein [Streptomyces scabiei]MDX2568262.1 hypothetical protein [Streptomyces scabiei]MDX2625666.1 hypothetical protein [Streptomyces scabiei]MDX2685258.1 hypothetical protein [Streptomyces scabiei]MDX2750259.1 hypothetical protein [Streptomyces scabiei]